MWVSLCWLFRPTAPFTSQPSHYQCPSPELWLARHPVLSRPFERPWESWKLESSTMKYRLLPGTLPKKPAKCKVIYRSETECTNICKHGTSGQKRKVQLPLSSKSFPTQATRLPPFTQSQSLEVSGAEVMCKTSCWRSSKKPRVPGSKEKNTNPMRWATFLSFQNLIQKMWCRYFLMKCRYMLLGWVQNGAETGSNFSVIQFPDSITKKHLFELPICKTLKHFLPGLREDLLLWGMHMQVGALKHWQIPCLRFALLRL